MHLEVITPEEKVFDGEVTAVTLPGAKGAFQVLKNHAPLISALGKGLLLINTDKGEKRMTVDGGVVEVLENSISVLAESLIKE